MPSLSCVSVEKILLLVMKTHATEVESGDRRDLYVLQALN